MNYCIIPARSKSKRIKNKNILSIKKKPIISYVIKCAKKTNLFDNIIVSTDSNKIKKISEKYGAKVPFLRNKKLSNDFATTNEVIKDTLKKIITKKNFKNFTFCIYPTAILIKPKHLKKALNKMKKLKADLIISTVKFNSHPQRAYKVRKGLIKMNYPQFKNTRSQDLEELMYDAGCFYIYDTKKLITNKIKKTTYYLLDNLTGIDVNTKDDIKFLKKIIN